MQHWRTLGHYTYWYDHPPLGWLLLAAWTSLTGAFDRAATAVAAGRELMLVLQLVSAALLYGVARRLGLRRPAAAGAVLVFSLSPLALGMHRAVTSTTSPPRWCWPPSCWRCRPPIGWPPTPPPGCPWPRPCWSRRPACCCCPAVLWQYWQVSDRRTRRYSLILAGSLFALVGAAYLLYATLRGELLPGPEHVSLVDAIRFQLTERAPSGSPLDPDSRAAAPWSSGSAKTHGCWPPPPC